MLSKSLSFQIRRVKSGWMSRREAGTKWQWCWARGEVGLQSSGAKRNHKKRGDKGGWRGEQSQALCETGSWIKRGRRRREVNIWKYVLKRGNCE